MHYLHDLLYRDIGKAYNGPMDEEDSKCGTRSPLYITSWLSVSHTVQCGSVGHTLKPRLCLESVGLSCRTKNFAPEFFCPEMIYTVIFSY